MSKILNHIKKLQRSDEKTKKRWVIGASAVTAALLIVSWGIYLNIDLPRIGSSDDVIVEQINDESVVAVLTRGIMVVGKNAKTLFFSVVESTNEFFGKSREYIFEP